MVGCQGRFNAEGDGSGRSYNQWARDGAIRQAETNVSASILFIAMSDEVHEATALFKSTNEPPPSGGKRFPT